MNYNLDFVNIYDKRRFQESVLNSQDIKLDKSNLPLWELIYSRTYSKSNTNIYWNVENMCFSGFFTVI